MEAWYNGSFSRMHRAVKGPRTSRWFDSLSETSPPEPHFMIRRPKDSRPIRKRGYRPRHEYFTRMTSKRLPAFEGPLDSPTKNTKASSSFATTTSDTTRLTSAVVNPK
eukprot:3368642-Pyramimonas_sp.AAC.1